jgi:hypothetical protein
MDYKLVSAGLAILSIVLASLILAGGTERVVEVNNTVYPQEGLRVYYMYPLRCVDCDLNKPGQCDYCTSYYDARLMDLLSQEVGVPVEFHVSDTVHRPSVLVVYDGKITLGDARTRYNIANTLCSFAKIEKSCTLFTGELERVEECVAAYGVEPGTVVYHTSSRQCPVCIGTDKSIKKLEGLEYEEGVGYSVHVVDHADEQALKILSDCFRAFDDVDYVPQLLCPVTGKDLTGEFTLSQASEFADNCIKAAG